MLMNEGDAVVALAAHACPHASAGIPIDIHGYGGIYDDHRRTDSCTAPPRRLLEDSQALSRITAEQRTVLCQVDQLQAQNNELFLALEKAEGASR